FDVASVISQLGTGEALVSTLQDKGVPMPVERTLICPPRCRMGAVTPEERAAVRARSPVGGKYDTRVNRESAYEILNKRAGGETTNAEAGDSAGPGKAEKPESSPWSEWLWGTKRRQGVLEALAKQMARSVGSAISNTVLRGVLGNKRR
ncbi:MAG: DUF853 family protein, partial [Planctomycetaceae bacterium]|nr:DUF853 family protein [Planctomycetaceae bacterium]